MTAASALIGPRYRLHSGAGGIIRPVAGPSLTAAQQPAQAGRRPRAAAVQVDHCGAMVRVQGCCQVFEEHCKRVTSHQAIALLGRVLANMP